MTESDGLSGKQKPPKVLDVEEVLPVSRRQLSAIRRILREGA